MLPTLEEIEALHRKYAPTNEAFELVFTHCRIIWDIAQHLNDVKPQKDIDMQLVEVGCLLHDIGVYTLYEDGVLNKENYITHGIHGYDLLKSEGFDERICRIASHHTGVGLSREQIIERKLPLPYEDFFAESVEERLVMYADKFHSKRPTFNAYNSYAKTVAQFGEENILRFEALTKEFGKPALGALALKYGHPIV